MNGALARLGRFTARHRLITIAAWLVIVAVAVGAVRVAGAKTDNTLTLPGTDSQAAFDLLAKEFPPQQNGSNPFVFSVGEGKLADPRYKPAMDATYHAIKSARDVYSVRNPVGKNAEAAGIISADGRIGIMPVVLRISSGFITDELAHRVLAATKPASEAGIEVAVGGSIGSVLSAPETRTSEILGNVAAMIILALVFGSLIAMGLPIITAALGLAITTSLIGLLGHLTSVPSVAPTLAIMIGLGVGIDYALFLITKHQEQLAAGVEMRESISRAVATSGTAIVLAGGTVVIAMASLAVAGVPLVTMLGIASAIAVFVAVLTSITLLPAILSLVGGGVDRLRVPAFLRMKARPEGDRRWDAWARWVTTHPWIAVAISAAILIPLLVPLFTLELGQPDVGVSPTSTTQRRAYDLTTRGFGVGYNGPLLVALNLDPVATPSAAYTSKYDEATTLQKELKRTQKRLEAQQAQLEAQKATLEGEKIQLSKDADALERRRSALERQAAALREQESRLRQEALALEQRARVLGRQIAPLVARLGIIEAREKVIERRIANTTDPNELRRLRHRLARLRGREARVRGRLMPLVRRAKQIARQAAALEAQKQQLVAQAAVLQRQADALQAQAQLLRRRRDRLERQAAALRKQADQLQAQADAANEQKQQALKLKRQLTTMLTKAGGNPLGTDPRIVAIQDALLATYNVAGISPPLINDSGSAAIMSSVSKRAPSSDATAQLVTVIRDDTLPPVTHDNGVTAHVGGTTATYVDLARKIASKMALVVLTVLALSFVFLLVTFRSLLVPVQAAITNLCSVGAALGVLTAVFQWGWGLSFVGLDAPGGTVPIASYVPLMMFAVLFGLSMDYEVFMVTRIQQRYADGDAPRDAVTSGVGGAAHVVTAAALIMFLVFASFIINGDPTIKQFGVGLATAVLLAGTMVVLLAPALLSLFSRALFRLPGGLDRLLPHLDIEGAAEPSSDAPDVEPASG